MAIEKHWKSEDWYQHLVEQGKALWVQKFYDARMGVIEAYHGLGTMILEQTENLARERIYGKNVANTIARDMGITPQRVWLSIQFVKKFPDIRKIPGGNEVSWNDVRKLLPEGKENGAAAISREDKFLAFAVDADPKKPYSSKLPIGELLSAVDKYRGVENETVNEDAEDFDSGTAVKKLANAKDQELSLLGEYFTVHGDIFPSQKALSAQIGRWRKVSQVLREYPYEQIIRAFDKVKEFPSWNLRTVLTHIPNV